MISVQAGERQRDVYLGAAAGLRIDFEFPAQMTDPLFHAEDAQTPRTLRIEAAPVVKDAQQNLPGFAADSHLDGVGLGVARAVVERLLHHSIDTRLVFLRKLTGEFALQLHMHAGTLGCFAGLPIERGDQAEVIQHRRPKQQRHVANFVDAFFGYAANGFQARADLGSGVQVEQVFGLHEHG